LGADAGNVGLLMKPVPRAYVGARSRIFTGERAGLRDRGDGWGRRRGCVSAAMVGGPLRDCVIAAMVGGPLRDCVIAAMVGGPLRDWRVRGDG